MKNQTDLGSFLSIAFTNIRDPVSIKFHFIKLTELSKGWLTDAASIRGLAWLTLQSSVVWARSYMRLVVAVQWCRLFIVKQVVWRRQNTYPATL